MQVGDMIHFKKTGQTAIYIGMSDTNHDWCPASDNCYRFWTARFGNCDFSIPRFERLERTNYVEVISASR